MSAIYDVSTIGTPLNSITFNNYNTFPVYRVRSILPPRFTVRSQDAPIPEMSGVADYRAYLGKTVIIIAGTMYAESEDQYYLGKEALRKLGSMDFSQNDAYSDNGYIPYTWNESGRGRQLFVKVEYADGMSESAGKGFIQDFKLICRVKNPKIYGTTVISALLNAPTTATGAGGAVIDAEIPMTIGDTGNSSGLTLPFTLPVALGSSTVSTSGTITNIGTIASFPAIQVYGPITKPRVTNTTSGEYLEVDVSLGANEALTIAYDEDTPPAITGLGGANLYNKVTQGSTFFVLKPGVSNFTLTGSAMSVGATGSVNFLPAYPLA